MAQQDAELDAAGGRAGVSGFVVLSMLAAVAVGWLIAAYPGLVWKLTLMREVALISTDDAMRLVEVRDLLAGQGWFDLTQYRLGPAGVEMHWSRLVDAPLAGLMLALRPALGPEGAEAATLFVWPLLLLVPALALTAAAGRALTGAPGMWAATLLLGAGLGNSGRFVPGQIDHHNLQLTLLIAAVSLSAIALRRPRAASGAGAAIAISIAVGVELLPIYALFFLSAALAWAVSGATSRALVRALCLGFAATLALVFVATAPASAWRGGYCDALSRDLLVPALAGALGLAAAAHWLSVAPGRARLAMLSALGAAVLGLAAGATPACLADPLAGIDPFLRTHWLDRVAEAEGWGALLVRAPASAGPTLIAALAALVSCAMLALSARAERWLWATIGGTVLLSLALAFWQHRAAMVLAPLAALPVATLACRLFLGRLGHGQAWHRLAAVTLFFAAVPMTWGPLLSELAPARQPQTTATAPAAAAYETWLCYRDGAMAALADLPPGLVSASSNLGAHILLAGPQRVLAAPYHRNTEGMTAQLRIALADDAAAEALLRQAGVDYVVACRHDGEYTGTGGFGERLGHGAAPPYLAPVAHDPGGIDIYRLRPPQ